MSDEAATIEEARQAKVELEKQIGELLTRYEQEYGLEIESVYVRNRIMKVDSATAIDYFVEVDVSI